MKTWQAPKLVILVRARPEESILISCKTYNVPTAGPDADDYWCWNYDCEQCSAEANS